MSLDLGPLFALGADLAAQAITTSGTEVSLSRNPKGRSDAATNRATLGLTDPAPAAPYATGQPAIVTPQPSAAQQPEGPNLTGQADVYQIDLLPDVVDVQERDEVTVTASLDARMVGRTFVVDHVADGTAGAVRRLICKKPPRTPGTP